MAIDRLLDGDDLRSALEVAMGAAKNRFLCISAYITRPATEWMLRHCSDDIQVELICRLNPQDVVSGGTDIEALKLALNHGATVKFLLPLHAKIYVLDDYEIFLGSANMTSSGLKIYGQGNLEVAVHRIVGNGDLSFINKIVSSARQLTLPMLEQMEAHLERIPENSGDMGSWPEAIVGRSSDIWVPDFFWADLEGDSEIDAIQHDLEILGLDTFSVDDKTMRQRVLQTQGIIWLTRLLDSTPDKSMYFGALTAQLHTDLQDDPLPYRSEIKLLLQNTLAYCQKYLPDDIEVLRPRYSQLVSLLSSSQVV